ncbi:MULTISPECIES: GFA family protein [Comamonas]|uniref:GFA family protein n=1 Tax=Comamonas TaxID=283 RepID=UPI00062283F1|nr:MULTISPECIES: GFA family protein [Comamonas]KKI13055.1 aldehyde-activating protein [Comamonas thiooxydans]TYK77678.1 GFA family protein [Comamonas sp. Z1]BCX53412.1 aldehyde-activating protein [Comamonas testosteroni]
MQARCLCKAVLVTAPDTHEVHVCHCSMCRRWGEGPAFTLHGGTAVQTSGPVTRYASSPWAERAFCSSCGTHLFYRLLASNEHFLSAGLFQDAQGLTLAQQIYIDEKPDYYALANDTPTLTGAEVQALYGDS